MTKYLLVRGIGGLGNRIFSLLTAIPFARLTGRKLVVEWCDRNYSDDGANVVHRYFRSPAFDPSGEVPQTRSVYPAIWREPLADVDKRWLRPLLPELLGHPHGWRYFSADPARPYHDEQVVVFLGYYPLFYRLRPHLCGEYEHLRFADQKTAYRQLFRENLELAPAIRRRVDEVKESWPRRPIIGVHARYTDRRVNLSSVHRQVRALLKREPEAAIFLATDNRDVLHQFSATYPNVLAPDRAYAPDGTALHRAPDLAGAAERGVQALVDLYLLAGSDYLVVDEGSAFSYLATLLWDKEPSRIHNIQRGWWLPDGLRHQIWSTWVEVKFIRKTVSHLRKRRRERSRFS